MTGLPIPVPTAGRVAVTRTGTVEVLLPASDALALFTPEGERSWVPGWAPRYPMGGTPALAEGVSFQTDADGGTATWLVTRYDPHARRASYAYVVPGHRATMVDVHVTAVDSGRSEVRVTYHMTSLAPEGDAFVGAFAEGFAQTMAEWTRALTEACQSDGITRSGTDGRPAGGMGWSTRPPRAAP